MYSVLSCLKKINYSLCGSRKYLYPRHRGSLEIPRRRGIFKAKIFKGKYEPKLEFPGGGVQTNKEKPPWGSMDIFWNNAFLWIIWTSFCGHTESR